MVRVPDITDSKPDCFPHARGDGPSGAKQKVAKEPFSPRTWGWSVGGAFDFLRLAVFPTHVGMVRDELIYLFN